jgi:atypical dual specificity phosphatase
MDKVFNHQNCNITNHENGIIYFNCMFGHENCINENDVKKYTKDKLICRNCAEMVEIMKKYSDNVPKIQSEIYQIDDKVFIGDKFSGVSLKYLKERNIDTIIVAAKGLDKFITSGIRYVELDLDDSLEEDISRYFDMCHDIISNNKNKTLVHCYSGISRSATIIIYYLMKAYKLNYKMAFEIIKSKRPTICPNSNFKKQLFSYSL